MDRSQLSLEDVETIITALGYRKSELRVELIETMTLLVALMEDEDANKEKIAKTITCIKELEILIDGHEEVIGKCHTQLKLKTNELYTRLYNDLASHSELQSLVNI
jgi:hypothetical protein